MCVTGKLIRKSLEHQMVAFAQELGLQCAIVEHPHLLSTQVAFNVTGPSSSIEQFDRYLKSEARATIRLDPDSSHTDSCSRRNGPPATLSLTTDPDLLSALA